MAGMWRERQAGMDWGLGHGDKKFGLSPWEPLVGCKEGRDTREQLAWEGAKLQVERLLSWLRDDRVRDNRSIWRDIVKGSSVSLGKV